MKGKISEQKINQMTSQNQNQEEDPSLVNPQPHLSTFGVLREAIKTTRRNGKLAMSILLIVFFSFDQLEFGCRLALEPILEDLSSYWPMSENSKVTSFENRPRVLVETPLPSPQPKRNSYAYPRAYPSGHWVQTNIKARKGERFYVYQRYPSSYNGYMSDRTKQASESIGANSYQPAYPTSNNGYTGDLTNQASYRKDAYPYHRAYPSSYNGYRGQKKEGSERKGAYSYQRTNPSSYNGYRTQNKQSSERKGAYSYQQTNPSSYGYMDQNKPMVEQKGVYSYHKAKPSSYGYMGETIPKGELKDVRTFLGLSLSILILSCVILLFFLVAAVSSSYEAYTAKVISLKDVFLKFRESWKRPIHTGFCLTLISLGLFILLVFFIGLISIFTEGSSAYVLYFALIISGSVWYFHMAALWMLSFVVSVLESDSSGLKAIIRAGELMKGKKCQAYFLILFFHFTIAGGVTMISSAYTRKLDQWSEMGITIPFTLILICEFKLLMFVAFTVYYHERKMNQREDKVVGRVGLYVPIASDEV